MSGKSTGDDLLQKAFGVAVAVGALAVGIAAAVSNNERARQVRDDLKVRVDDLTKRVDDLTAQAQRTIEEHRPEVEQALQRGKQAVVEGLDKAKAAVEQGAEKAQTYVQRAGHEADNKAGEAAAAAGDSAYSSAEAGSHGGSDYGAATEDGLAGQSEAAFGFTTPELDGSPAASSEMSGMNVEHGMWNSNGGEEGSSTTASQDNGGVTDMSGGWTSNASDLEGGTAEGSTADTEEGAQSTRPFNITETSAESDPSHQDDTGTSNRTENY